MRARSRERTTARATGKLSLGRAPKTPLQRVDLQPALLRRASLPLAEIKALGERTGASVNDVVMAICAGALKRYLEDYDCSRRSR